MIKILFVCHGNICRSVMAQYMMQDLVDRAGTAGQYVIDSAAMTTEEIGNAIYPPARRKLEEKGVPIGTHRARLITRADCADFDLLIGMDGENMRMLHTVAGSKYADKCFRLLEFAGETGAISDPWYTRDFERAYQDILRGVKGLVEYCKGR